MNEEKSKMLKLTTDQIETKFGKGSIMKFGEGGHDLNIGVIPTGALPLDAALGIGGVPRGRIVEVYGPESSGKTTLALQIHGRGPGHGRHRRRSSTPSTRSTRSTPRAWAWTSTRCSSPSPTPASRRWRSATCWCVRAPSTCIVVDSVAALVPRAEIEGEMGDTTRGPAGAPA